MTKTMLRVNTDGTHEFMTVGEDDELGTYQNVVGGFIEHVGFPLFGLSMYINEEGKLDDLPMNLFATKLWAAEYGHTDYIVGNVVIFNGEVTDDGESVGLTSEQVALLTDALAKA